MTTGQYARTVVVAGGGYAGVLAANRLAGKLGPSIRIQLVTSGDVLTDRIRLHEAAARGRNVELQLGRLLHRRVERVNARVIGLDPAAHRLHIARAGEPEALRYDALLLALGSVLGQSLPSTDAPHAHALRDAPSARALHGALRDLPAGARVAVVGGGLTGVELASELAEAQPRLQVVLMCDALVQGLAGPAQRAVERALRASGVELRSGVQVAGLERAGVRLLDGSLEPCALSVLATGFAPAPLGEAFRLPRTAEGRVPVDETLRVEGLSDVFAAGDLSAPPASVIGTGERSTRMGCVSAMPLAAHAADQIVRLLEREPLTPFHFSYMIQCISVGRRRAVVAFVDPNDRPTGRAITGRRGALIKELICRFVLGAIRLERLFAGLYAWPGRRHLRALPGAAVRQLPG